MQTNYMHVCVCRDEDGGREVYKVEDEQNMERVVRKQ